ncbi:hypothetical protein N7481_002825 [Penicillium waksmanii]|uniref:uncharacterized protein n=1 Tax=Penicillium waksmanii TaxID=69791 RepID=UPI0025474DC1|nr:uncharacterized protein N7481_002825 [Penicillium waksmanii]KAJ5995848.1 hypothetical protein N7481_002825 [Penicillium waksmanii]
MCIDMIPRKAASPTPEPANPGSTCFTASRLNDTTFQIVEDDKFLEMPIIYAKVYPSVLVLLDTGCGGAARDPSVELRSLRSFLETVPVKDNSEAPLNSGGEREYLVICTHCHFDHIGGIEQFVETDGSTVWASDYDKDYLSPTRLPSTSLCDKLNIKTPEYTVTNWCSDGQQVIDRVGHDLHLTVYHIPGHTPDEIAIWDSHERILFVGDSMYQHAPIFLFETQSVIRYSESIGKMRQLVRRFNAETEQRAKISCSHITSSIDAADFLAEVDAFLYEVVTGQVERKGSSDMSGHPRDSYSRKDGGLEFQGRREYFEEFTASKKAMNSIRKRQLWNGQADACCLLCT